MANAFKKYIYLIINLTLSVKNIKIFCKTQRINKVSKGLNNKQLFAMLIDYYNYCDVKVLIIYIFCIIKSIFLNIINLIKISYVKIYLQKMKIKKMNKKV